MGNSGDGSSCFVYFAVFATSLTAFATGSCFVWTSPFLPKFQSSIPEENPTGRPVTTFESAWIVSAMPLGLILGPLLSVACLKFFTKKKVLLLAVAPILVAHIICFFATEANIFIIARNFMGIGTGAVWAVLGSYIAEISEKGNRGLLGSIPGIMSNFGSLLVYVLGPYLQMKLFSMVIIIPIILFYIGFGFFVPDSPYDLLVKNRQNQAEKSLQILRRKIYVKKELTLIQETIECGSTDKVRVMDLFKDRSIRKGLIICIALMMIQQLSGVVAVVSYAQIIFKQAGDFMSSEISAIVLGIVGTSGMFLSLFLIDKMGRKVLITSSCILESISLFTLGLYFFLLKSDLDVSSISWLPIACLMLFMLTFNFALALVPWVVMGEVFRSNVKALASTIAALSNFVISFIVSLCFPYMVQYFGMDWTFWIFAMFMVLGFIFCILVLPETKGKTFQEIQDILKV